MGIGFNMDTALGVSTGGLYTLGKSMSKQVDPNAYSQVPELGALPRLQDQPRGEFEQMLRQQALAKGPTQAAMNQAGRAGQLAQTGAAQGFSNLAQRGGASAGARERLAKQAALQGMLGKQQAYAAGEQQKLGMQQGFAQQEGQERQFDMQAQLEQQRMRNQLQAAALQNKQQMELQNRTGGLLGSGGILGSGMRI